MKSDEYHIVNSTVVGSIPTLEMEVTFISSLVVIKQIVALISVAQHSL